MTAQPTGTVTLLFTDVEGSTRLLERLGTKRYAETLELHRSALRAAFDADGGFEFGTEGDAFFVAFGRAEDATAAAAAGQRALAEAIWPDGAELRVRMGIHTGEPYGRANSTSSFAAASRSRPRSSPNADSATCAFSSDTALPSSK